MSPDDTDGPPDVMPSNDWWNSDLAQQVVAGATKVALARYQTPAADKGIIASNAKNPPPGGGGLFFQASATGGARPIGSGAPAAPGTAANGDLLHAAGGWLVPVAVVAAVALFLVLRRR